MHRSCAFSLVLVVTLAAAACQDALPVNEYDPRAPVSAQARATVKGVLLLDDVDATPSVMHAELQALSVHLLDAAGEQLLVASCAAEATAAASMSCDDAAHTARFELKDLVAGDYRLVVDGVNPRYLPAAIPAIELLPGEVKDLGTLRYAVIRTDQPDVAWTGRVVVEARLMAGEGGARRVTLYRQGSSGLEAQAVALTDAGGEVVFEKVPPGVYAVAAELDAYTPDYRAGFSIQGSTVPVDENTQFFTGDQGLTLHPVTAVLIPALQQTFGQYYTNGDVAPVEVLQFGGMNQMRLSTDPSFASGTLTWLDYTASTDVALPAVEGPIPVHAQFRNTQVDGFVFVSSVYSATVVRDVSAPTVEGLRVRGRTAGDDGKIWYGTESPLLGVEVDGQDAVSAVYSYALFHDAANGAGDPASLSFTLTESPGGLVRLDEELGLTAGEGEKKIFVYLKDRAGNVSTAGELGVWVDATPPVVDALVLDGGAAVTGDGVVTVALQASDQNGVVAMQVWEEGQAEPTAVPFSEAWTLRLAALDHARTQRQVNARVWDVAGNPSLLDAATIVFDDRGSLAGTLQIEDAADGSAGDSAGVVALVDGTSMPAQFAATGNRGEFTFTLPGIAAGANRRLVLQKADYADAVAPALYTVTPGVTTTVGALNLLLARGAVEGFALLQGQGNHEGIFVSVQGTALEDYTGRDGDFRIEGLKAGVPYVLNFRRDDTWSVETRPNVVVPAAGTLTLEPAVVLIPLAGSLRIAEGDYTADPRITLLMSYDGATEYRASEDPDFAGATWQAFSNAVGPTTGYAFDLLVDGAHGDGARTVWVQFRDPTPGTGFLSEARSDVITLDRLPPENVVLTINGGAAYTATLAVTLAMRGNDPAQNPITHYQLSYRDTASAGDLVEADWEPARAFTGQPVGVVLPGSASFRTARVWLRLMDAAGNASAPALASIVVDPAGPTGAGLVINDGAAVTSSFTVTLTLSASDDSPIEMLIANGPVPATGSWQAFSASTAWVLPPAEQGEKTVCVAFRDAAGTRVADACDSIDYDSVAPAAPAVTATPTVTSGTRIHLDFTNWTAGDRIEVASNAAFAAALTSPAQARVDFDLADPDGAKFVFVRYVDAAGNAGPAAVLTVVLDRVSPEAASFVIVDGTYTNRLRTPLALTALGASQMKISTNATCAGGSWVSYATSAYVDLVAPDGLKDVSVLFRDAALNTTTCLSRQVTLDTRAPTLQATPLVLSDPRISVSGGAVTGITLRLDFAVDVADAFEMKVSNQAGLADATWQPFRTYVTDWPVSLGEGTKVVRAMLRDRAGNTTAEFSGSLFVRTTGDITGTVTLEGSSDLTGLAFYLDGSPVTPSFAGNTFTISNRLVKFYSSLLVQKTGYDSRSVTGIQVQPGLTVDVGNVSLLLSRGNIEGYARLADKSSHEGIFVELQSTGYNARTNSAGYFFIEDVLVGSYDLRASRDGYSAQSAPGLVVVTGATTQASTQAAPLVLPVLSGDFSINGGASYTSATTVHLNLSQAGASLYRASESEDFAGGSVAWLAYAGDGNYDFVLESTDQGVHTIYVQFDVGGTLSDTYESSIILDTVRPTQGTLVLAGGALAINSLNISAELASTDSNGIAKMAFSTDGTTFAPAITFQTPYTYSFTGGEGTKRLYVRFIDPAGNASVLPAASDDIIYDRTPPTGTIAIVDALGAPYPGNRTRSASVFVKVTTGDGLEMKLSNNSGFPGVTWRPYDGSLLPWNLDGGDGLRPVYLALRDRAGNEAAGTAGMDASVTVDSTPPAAPVFTVVEGNEINTTTVTLDYANRVQDAENLTVLLRSNRDLEHPVTDGSGNDPAAYTLPAVDGLHILDVRYRDLAGNESQASTASVTLDREVPEVVSFAVEGNGYTRTAGVTLLVEARGASEMRFSNSTTFSTAWEAYQTRRQGWLVNTASQGEKNIYIQVRDAAGNVTAGALPAKVTYDTQAPSGTLQLAGGQNPVNTRSVVVEVSGASADVAGIAVGDGALACDSTSTVYQGFVARLDYTLPLANSANAVRVCLRDLAGNATTLPGNVTHDDVKPQLSVVVPKDTNHADGLISVSVTVAGETQTVAVTLSSPAATSASFNIVPATNPTGSGQIALTPAAGGAPDGSVLLTIEARDQAGNVTTVNRIVVVDREAPLLDGLSCASCIDTGSALLATDAAVTLAITASGATEMRFTGNVASTTSWQPFAALASVTLSAGAGSKTVNVELRDQVLNLSVPTLLPIVITLDPPVAGKPTAGTVAVSGTDKDGASALRTRLSRITVTTSGFADNAGGSGLTHYMISESSVFTGAVWQECPTGSGCNFAQPWDLSAGDGNKTVYVKVKDAAGNASDPASNATAIRLDTTPPMLSAVLRGTVAGTTRSTTYTRLLGIDVEPTASDGGSGLSPTTGLLQVSEAADFAGASWEALANPRAYTFAAGEGLRRVYVKVRDLAGNERTTDASIIVDTEQPSLGSVYFGEGGIVTTTAATLNIVASGATEMRLTGHLTAPSPNTWLPFAPTTAVTLTTGDNEKTVTVELRDAAGNSSNPTSREAKIRLDTPTTGKPTAGTVTVRGLAKDGLSTAYTRTRAVTVTTAGFADNTDGSGLTHYMISESSVFTGAAWAECPAGSACNFDIPFTLSSAEGDKTVYVKVKDAANNESNPSNNPTPIKLDTLPPLVSVELIGTVAGSTTSTQYTRLSTVTVDQTASDTGSGLSPTTGLMKVSNYSSFSGASWQALGDLASWTLYSSTTNGTKRVYVRVQDLAGNYADADATIIYDSVPPYAAQVVIDDGAAYTDATAGHTLTLAASDKLSGVTEMCLSNTTTCSSWEAYADTKSAWSLAAGEGYQTVYAWFRDAAGNAIASAVQDRIIVDLAVPTGVSFTVNGYASGACVAGGGEHWVYSTDVGVRLRGLDTVGIEAYKFAEGGNFDSVPWVAWPGDNKLVSHFISSAPGEKTLHLRVKDHVDNEVDAATVCVTLDSSPPTVGGMEMHSNSACTAPVTTTCYASTLRRDVPCTAASSFYLRVEADPGAGGSTLNGMAFVDNSDIDYIYNQSGVSPYNYYNSETASLYHYYSETLNVMPFRTCVRVYVDTASATTETLTGKVRNSYNAWSSTGSFAFLYDATPPSTPALGYVSVGNAQATGYWSAATDSESGVAAYRLYYSSDASVTTSDPYVEVDSSTFSVTVTGLTSRRHYWFNVVSVNGAGALSPLDATQVKQVAVGYQKTQVLSSATPVIPVDIEIDAGAIYVLYLELQGGAWGDPASTLHLARSDDWGHTWSKFVVDPTAAKNREDADIAVSDGLIFVASLGDDTASNNDDLNVWVSGDRGATWELEQTWPDMGRASHGLAMFSEGGGLGIVFSKYVSASDSDPWVTRRSLKRSTDNPPVLWTDPAVLRDTADNLWTGRRWRACANDATLNVLAQRDTTTLANLASFNHGTSYAYDQSFSTTTSGSADMACSAYGNGEVYVALRSDNDLRIAYSTNDGYTWSGPTTILSDEVDTGSDPAIWVSDRVDGHNIFVAYRDDDDGSVWVRESFNPTTGYVSVMVDDSGLGGVNIVMTGQGPETVALAYADVEGLSITLVTTSLPAPDSHPMAVHNLAALSWSEVEADTYQVRYGDAQASMTTLVQTPTASYSWTDESEAPYCTVQALDDQGQEGDYGPIYQVSGFVETTVGSGTVSGKGSHFTRLVADGDLVVLLPPLGWTDSTYSPTNVSDLFVYASYDGGATWTTDEAYGVTDSYPMTFATMGYTNGRVHVVFTTPGATTGVDEYLRHRYGTVSGTDISWSTTRTIDSTDIMAHEWIDIATNGDRVVAAYQQRRTSDNQTYLGFACSDDNGENWTTVGSTRWINFGTLSAADARPQAISIGYISNEACSGIDIRLAYVRDAGTTYAQPCSRYTTDGGTSWSAEYCDLGQQDAMYSIANAALMSYEYETTVNQNQELLFGSYGLALTTSPWIATSGYSASNGTTYRSQSLDSESILGTDLDSANLARVRNSDGLYAVYTTTFNFLGISKHGLKLGYCQSNCHGPDAWETRTVKVQNSPDASDMSAVSLAIEPASKQIYIGYQMGTGTDTLRVLRSGVLRRVR